MRSIYAMTPCITQVELIKKWLRERLCGEFFMCTRIEKPMEQGQKYLVEAVVLMKLSEHMKLPDVMGWYCYRVKSGEEVCACYHKGCSAYHCLGLN